ncbi:DUF4382 domain-containing protein [Shewanella aestuarii]|uniref:DUF4382 domain-containing protein n=1 Tax=Shewanella aestuarii TaxID=1028752 RepID=A0A6G9QM31_9GAMM|nr:DUF4382 domain-containing protein [Shewanella aestuarii]QIR15606.1 DUF4382 domain-containing protein [Shewanella aestuarii]
MKFSKSVICLALLSTLTACGGSDDSKPAPEMGVFSLGVSDNPADAQIVNIAFKQVVLKPTNGSPSLSFDVSENGELKHVDLLTVQGQDTETLVPSESVLVGEYQMCIYMQNSLVADTNSSYVQTLDGVDAGLVTNSNGSCGGEGAEEDGTGRLFFNKAFTIAAGTNSFVAEFNLAKGLQAPKGGKSYWTLKPTSVQLVNEAEVGAISGQISDSVMSACEVAAGGSEFSPAVYLYPSDTILANMADFRETDLVEPLVAPIASARVNPIVDESETVTGYEYEFGFVSAASYSLGYTCVANRDDPDLVNTPDDELEPFFIHVDEQAVEVTEGNTTERHFPLDFAPAS